MEMLGAKAVIESFLAEGVDTIFGYPGGTIMPVYDALYDYTDRINHILVRHEQAAVHAAEGYARVSGKVGVCMVTSGPGSTNTVTGLADALLDSTPVVVVSGQVASPLLGTDAFQETNFVSLTQVVTKWNYLVKNVEEIPEVLAKAFYIARSGRPGPVVIDITKDAFFKKVDFNYKKMTHIRSYIPQSEVSRDSINEAAALINRSRKPLLMVGQGVSIANAEKELEAFLEKSGMPAAATLLGLSALPSNHRQFVGMLGMHGNYAPNIKNRDCDLIISMGMRFDDRVTGDPKTFALNAKVIHFEIDPAEVNKIIFADVPVIGNLKESLPMITEAIAPAQHEEWLEEFRACEKVEEDKIIYRDLHPDEGDLKMPEVIRKVSEAYGNNAILVTDVGQQQMMAARYFKFSQPKSIVTSGGLGTMGFGLPAAIGAKIGAPDRDVCLFAGDGGIQMNIQEFCTIMQSHVDVKIIILNNSFLGMVRQWQELFFDKRYSFTSLLNPDFSLIAQANQIGYGLLKDRKDIDAAIAKMKSHPGAYILEVRVEPEENVFPMVPAGASLSDIRLE